MPPGIAAYLAVLRILLGYAHHLAATLESRAATRGFGILAQYFGTARLPAIVARLTRGIRLAMALERLLLARAARGRDLLPLGRRQPGKRRPPPDPGDPAAPPHPARRHAAPLCDHRQPPDPAALPSLEQLQARIRRRPIGRTLADICRDLAISPSLCEGRFWTALTCAISWYRGDVPGLMRDLRQREIDFERELDRTPTLDWPPDSRDAIHDWMGCFIGEVTSLPIPRFEWGEAAAVARPP